MSIQRYNWDLDFMDEEPDGEFVLYSDHVKSINMASMKAYQYLALTGNKDAAEKISQIILEAGR